MRILLFVPSYNDTEMAHRLALKFLENENIKRVLIVDDSDDPICIQMAREIKDEKINVLQRERTGKWTAWKLALELARTYDGLIEVDSDVQVECPNYIVTSLEKNDLVTAYPNIILPLRGLGRMISMVYKGMHADMKSAGRFSMGGQLVALSKKTILSFLNKGFFEEPVAADDHVVALGAYVLGLKCATIDCGLHIRLPLTLNEWIRFRSRHRGAIAWAERYVASKTGKTVQTIEASRSDFNISYRYFLKNLLKSLKLLAPAVVLLLALGSVLPIEDRTEWSRLKGERF
jgi:hypothetical protein